MILVDTSAWVEFLRGTGSRVGNRLEALLGDEVAICDVVRMEVLAGARDERHLHQLRRLLARATLVTMRPADYEEAAAIFRRCRRGGRTPRRIIDCLIAAAALRTGLSVLHSDADFVAISEHTELQIDSV